MSAINPGRGQKREFEGDHPPSQRARVTAEDNQFLADDLTRLENDFNHLLAGQYNYDLVRRVEAFRTHHLTSLSHSTLYSLSERLLGRFTTTTSMRVDRLYNNILDRHNLQKDYIDHSRTLIEEAISSYDCERIAFLCRDLSYMERIEVLKFAVKNKHIPIKSLLEALNAIIGASPDARLEALNAIIGASPDARLLRREVVETAAGSGDLEIVKALLANCPNSEEMRSLAVMSGARNGRLEIVKALLANGPILEQARSLAVESGAINGHLEIVKALLANGPISEMARGWAVMSGARNGHLEIVEALLANGPISEMARDSAVDSGADNGHLEIVRALLSDGAVISYSVRGSAARFAVRNGNLLMLQILLENGAISEEEQMRCLAKARRDRRDDLIAALNRAQILVEPGVFILSFEEVQANPRAFLEKVAAEGFPKSIKLLNSLGELTDVLDNGGVRKGFIRTLFASLQPLYNLGANVIPTAETEAQKELFRILGRFLSKLDEANQGNQVPFLIGSFIHTGFYEILKTVATEKNPEIQKQRVAGILLSLDANYATLVNSILNPHDENALKAYAEASYCLAKGIDEWEPATDPTDTLQAAKDALESYIAPARCILEGASENLKLKILTKDPKEIARSFQGAPVSQQGLIDALKIYNASPLLTKQSQWIKEKAASSDVEWCTRFIKWATERDCIDIQGAIYLKASDYDLIAHTCSSTIDMPSALKNREDFLAALDSVLDCELNSA